VIFPLHDSPPPQSSPKHPDGVRVHGIGGKKFLWKLKGEGAEVGNIRLPYRASTGRERREGKKKERGREGGLEGRRKGGKNLRLQHGAGNISPPPCSSPRAKTFHWQSPG
jgi:hypothetical protein